MLTNWNWSAETSLLFLLDFFRNFNLPCQTMSVKGAKYKGRKGSDGGFHLSISVLFGADGCSWKKSDGQIYDGKKVQRCEKQSCRTFCYLLTVESALFLQREHSGNCNAALAFGWLVFSGDPGCRLEGATTLSRGARTNYQVGIAHDKQLHKYLRPIEFVTRRSQPRHGKLLWTQGCTRHTKQLHCFNSSSPLANTRCHIPWRIITLLVYYALTSPSKNLLKSITYTRRCVSTSSCFPRAWTNHSTNVFFVINFG